MVTAVKPTLEDYCDGESFKVHPLFSRHKESLQILFYYDEVEICNPLGSSRGKHKLGMSSKISTMRTLLNIVLYTHVGMFYYHLDNLHPRYRSQTKVIQLAAICRHKYIKKYSISSVMEPIVKDLIALVSNINLTACMYS